MPRSAHAQGVFDEYSDDDYDLGPTSDDPYFVNVAVAPRGNAVPSIEVFYDALAPYGFWYDDPLYG